VPVVTVYRSHCSISREAPRPYAIAWTEYAYGPADGGHRVSPAGWTHWRSGAEPIRIRVPPGPIRPADAEAVYHLAARGEDGYRLEGDDTMAKTKRDDGPTLFGGAEGDAPAVGAYGPAKQGGGPIRPDRTDPPDPAAERARLAAIAAELVREERAAVVRRIEYLEGAAARALATVAAAIEAGDLARLQTARAILEEMAGAPRPAAGGETEAA
jgi:hypothetical protein